MSFINIGIIVGFAATLITVISSVVILVRHFDKLENKVDRIRDGLNQNTRQGNNILGLLSLSHTGLRKTKMGDIAPSPSVGMTSGWEI